MTTQTKPPHPGDDSAQRIRAALAKLRGGAVEPDTQTGEEDDRG